MYYLITGALLGVSAGLAPGPLLTLVISETLRHDVRAGIRVAIVPVVTDLPIILVTFLVLSGLSGFDRILGGISIVGGLFVFWMGYDSLRTPGIDPDQRATAPKSFLKGVLANALSPHPYLFWLSIGGPITAQALDAGLAQALLFVASFYTALVGAKILLALAAGRSKALLSGRAYRYLMRALGLMLMALALALMQDGFTRLKD